MDIYVLNDKFERIAIIDNYASFIWTTRYNSPGEFEIYMPADASMLSLFKKGYYIAKEICQILDMIYGDYTELTYAQLEDSTYDSLKRTSNCNPNIKRQTMIIETVKLTTDTEEGDYVTVSGRSIESLLARRIVWGRTSLRGRIEDSIRALIFDNIINPVDDVRTIPQLKLGTYANLEATTDSQFLGDNILDIVNTICQQKDVGYKVTLVDGLFYFELYTGVDRSYNQKVNPWVVFSPQYENILSTEYTSDATNYRNSALVSGGGDAYGEARFRVAVGTATGLDRREMYVDAGDISNSDATMPDYVYIDTLRNKGYEALANAAIKPEFSGELDTRQSMYQKDYDVGDIVQLETEYGVHARARVTEVVECWDELGYKAIPTLSRWDEN